MSDPKKNDMRPVYLQTLICAAIGLILCAAAELIYPFLCKAVNIEYSLLKYVLGGLYGWLLGVLNFFAMGVSLVLITAHVTDRQEGQKRGQTLFTVRLVSVLALAVAGCFIPVFHPLPILASLALTQLGIMLYALIFKGAEAKKKASGQAPEGVQKSGEGKEEPFSTQEHDHDE